LISESISTLKHSLLEEAIIVSLVIIVFLFHFRSALIPILTLPIALVISFIPMYYLNVSSNIMFWVGWRWPLVFWWTPPSSWWKTDIGIFPNARHQEEKRSRR